MDSKKAKSIGLKNSAIAVTLGLLLTHLFWAYQTFDRTNNIFNAILWFDQLDFISIVNLLISIVVAYLCGLLYGQSAAKSILFKHKNNLLMSIKFGLLTLITTAIISGFIFFFQEGVDKVGEVNENPVIDNMLTPIYWTTMAGIIPALLMSAWFGYKIKKRQKF